VASLAFSRGVFFPNEKAKPISSALDRAACQGAARRSQKDKAKPIFGARHQA